ncbi:MAG: hypothetical protein A2Z31_02695 [candidate division NC10 bacterium RBG_16_65_8]|nr:MAG: hypothetical protein A2Z31_02695 [candidate division NC10 bacterium RBG_16_65_8]
MDELYKDFPIRNQDTDVRATLDLLQAWGAPAHERSDGACGGASWPWPTGCRPGRWSGAEQGPCASARRDVCRLALIGP